MVCNQVKHCRAVSSSSPHKVKGAVLLLMSQGVEPGCIAQPADVLCVAGGFQESQQQGPPTPGLQDARRPGRMGEDAWDAFPAQDHPASAASASLQSPPLIDFTDTEAQPAATQGERCLP